jgi:hypothetical protein
VPSRQSVASEQRPEPRQAADEHQLQQHRRADQEPGQSAERHSVSARCATQQQVAGGVPPRDAKHRGVKPAGRGEPLRRRDASLAVTRQDAIGYCFHADRLLRGAGLSASRSLGAERSLGFVYTHAPSFRPNEHCSQRRSPASLRLARRLRLRDRSRLDILRLTCGLPQIFPTDARDVPQIRARSGTLEYSRPASA